MNTLVAAPKKMGITQLVDIDLKEIVPFIDWNFFFLAWRLPGKYEGIENLCNCTSCEVGWLQQFPENNRTKAEEALKLFRDAQQMLQHFLHEKSISIHAIFGFFPAVSQGDDLLISFGDKTYILPTLRQQHASSDGFCYSLADFINTENDYMGAFATTVEGAETMAENFEREDDLYRAIMVKTLSDRLAEAAAEWLHYKVRTEFWGYAPDEPLEIKNILKGKYQGIRPAVGYPSLPDQSIIFELQSLLGLEKIGIRLTENGAMFPNASVCGLYFSHPKSRYFMIGKINDEQLEDYARRRGKTVQEMKKWLAANI